MGAFIDRLGKDPSQPRKYMRYSDFMRVGVMRPLTVRLPASTVAKLNELFARCPGAWRSRQELLFELIEASVEDYITAQPQEQTVRNVFQEIARKALQRFPWEINTDINGKSTPIAADDVDDVVAFVTRSAPGVPASELKKHLRRLILENNGNPLSLEFVRNWLGKTGWVDRKSAELLFQSAPPT